MSKVYCTYCDRWYLTETQRACFKCPKLFCPDCFEKHKSPEGCLNLYTGKLYSELLMKCNYKANIKEDLYDGICENKVDFTCYFCGVSRCNSHSRGFEGPRICTSCNRKYEIVKKAEKMQMIGVESRMYNSIGRIK